MNNANVIYLVAEDPATHGVFEEYTPQQRLVYCVVRSVSRSEVYQALSHDLNPEFVFELSNYAEYKGENLVIFNGQQYDVIRTYINDNEGIEITVGR